MSISHHVFKSKLFYLSEFLVSEIASISTKKGPFFIKSNSIFFSEHLYLPPGLKFKKAEYLNFLPMTLNVLP